MNDLFNQLGNFFFHTRNVLFPILIAMVLFIWPPVAIDNAPAIYLMAIGLLMIMMGQGLRILTIGLAYISRGGRKQTYLCRKFGHGWPFFTLQKSAVLRQCPNRQRILICVR